MTNGARLGDYRLDGVLGRGGMGEVHRATDTRRSRAVALKILRPDLAADPGFRERFRREASMTAGLENPHIVPIHDFGEIDGRLFIDMRLVQGSGLDAVLAHGPLGAVRAASIVAQVADGLGHAHDHGVLHRDVKPSNILLTPSDFAYVVDFGIAYRPDGTDPGLTATGTTIGTWAYMAPERFDQGPVDQRADVYSLACVLAECLLGRQPFDGTGPASLMKAHLVAPPPRPSLERQDVPPALDAVLERGMAKDPARRFGSVREFAAAVNAAVDPARPAPTRSWPATLPAPAAPPPAPRPGGSDAAAPGPSGAVPVRAARGRTPVLVGIGVAALVLAVAAGVGIGRLSGPATPDATAASAAVTPAAPSTAAPAPALPASGAEATDGSSAYTYTVSGNYPMRLIYTDANGDRITSGETPAPWSITFDTSRWGADARPSLSAITMSSRGDSYLECTITDADGRVVANQRKETAHATVMCMSFG